MDDDYSTFSCMLVIDKHGLDAALLSHSDVMFRIGEKVAGLDDDIERAADKVKLAEADAFAKAKANAASDALAKEVARAYPLRLSLWDGMQRSIAERARWQNLYEAWKQRGHALRELVQLYSVQYFSIDPAGGVSRRERPPVVRSGESPARSRR